MNEPVLKFYDDSGYEKAIDALKASDRHLVSRKVAFPNPRQVNITNQPGYENYTIHRGILSQSLT